MKETHVEGEYTDATIFLPEEEIEEEAYEQVERLVNHGWAENTVRLMPDMHWGAGATIGFTMPLGDRVPPNVVGVDIGCGMTAIKLEGVEADQWDDDEWVERFDRQVRWAVPMSYHVHDRGPLHMHDEFPWVQCALKAWKFRDVTGNDITDAEWFDGYGADYFDGLCDRVEYDKGRAINSVGTLGGGNHFIEISESVEDGSVWVVVHSGSRGIGKAIADYWQDQAHEQTFQREARVEIPEHEMQYFEDFEHLDYQFNKHSDPVVLARPEDLSIDREAVLEDYEGEAIEGKFGQLKSFMQAGKTDKDPLDYLEGEEALGYYADMIFAQTYAAISRRLMLREVAHILGGEVVDEIHSPHNYISFEDGIIRKGATPAHENQRIIIPFNMQYGTLIARGKGNKDWNYSAPHGAGRIMSRTEAKSRFSADSVADEMDGIHTTKIPLDEAPGAYKLPELIEEQIEPTAEVVDRLVPIHNFKA